MVCSSCGQTNTQNDRFCFHCGAPLPNPPKKGRWWPPVLVLFLMFSLGLSIFFLFRPESKIVTDPAAPWFSLLDGTLYFNESVYTGNGTLTVPAAIGGQTVTAVSDSCFFDCDTLVAIHLPATLTHIGPDAFYSCNNLRAVQLPESLKVLGSAAFHDCVNLEAVCIPGSLTAPEEDIFIGCSSLSYIFYSGTLADWQALGLYGIPTGTVLSCSDGLYTMN